jgi:hypothetical protein
LLASQTSVDSARFVVIGHRFDAVQTRLRIGTQAIQYDQFPIHVQNMTWLARNQLAVYQQMSG